MAYRGNMRGSHAMRNANSNADNNILRNFFDQLARLHEQYSINFRRIFRDNNVEYPVTYHRCTYVDRFEDAQGRITSLEAQNASKDGTIVHQKKFIENLEQQMAELKRSIAVSRQIDDQISDDRFQEMGKDLNFEVQNWATNHAKGLKIVKSFQNMSENSRELVGNVFSTFQAFEQLHSRHIAQAMFAAHLTTILREGFLFGGNETDGSHVQRLVDSLRDGESQAFNAWRSKTFRLFLKKAPEGDDQLISHAVQFNANKIESAICELFGTTTSASRYNKLCDIINRTVQLGFKFHSQRAQFQFRFTPSLPGELFKTEEMVDEWGEEMPSHQGKTVLCGLSPFVQKFGDELGDNMHMANVILKEKVLVLENKVQRADPEPQTRSMNEIISKRNELGAQSHQRLLKPH